MRYHTSIRIIHWLMALIIISLLAVGLYMTGMDKEDEMRGTFYFLHKSFGVAVILLLAVRIFLRKKHGAPEMPDTLKPAEKKGAKAAHHMLYVLMFAVPTVGILMSNSWGYPAPFFGLADFRIFPENKDIAPLAGDAHEWLAYILIGIISLHVLGALKHRFIDKNDVIYRMSWGKAPEQK